MAEQYPFKWRHFEAEIILLCVRWYLRYALSYRDLEEMMRERGLQVDHTTMYRWVQRYAPELEKRCRPHLKECNASWNVDAHDIRNEIAERRVVGVNRQETGKRETVCVFLRREIPIFLPRKKTQKKYDTLFSPCPNRPNVRSLHAFVARGSGRSGSCVGPVWPAESH